MTGMKLFTLGRPFHTQAGKHRNGSGSNASPATDGHAVFAYFKSGTLAALQLDGRVRWQTNLVERFGPDTLYWDEFLPLFEIGSDAVPYLVPTMLAELNRANVAARRGACLVLGG